MSLVLLSKDDLETQFQFRVLNDDTKVKINHWEARNGHRTLQIAEKKREKNQPQTKQERR